MQTNLPMPLPHETEFWFDELANSIKADLEQTGHTVHRQSNSVCIGLFWAGQAETGYPILIVQLLNHSLYFNSDHTKLVVDDMAHLKFEYADPAFPDNLRSRLKLPLLAD